MSKHTPGPWRVGSHKHNILADTPDSDHFNNAVLVATAHVIGMNRPDESAECHANAKLMAAAPELLAIVNELIGDYQAVGDVEAARGVWYDIGETFEYAKALVKRITD